MSEQSQRVQCCLYLRVSTSDQNCDLQRRELMEYCQRRGWEIVEIYTDLGVSGSKASRPALDKLHHDAALAKFSTVLVWKLDRFGRSVRNCLDGIEALSGHGVRFLAVSQSIDTDESNPTSRLLLHILASVAEFERELIRERLRADVRSAKHRGVKLGRKRVVFDRSRALEMHQAGTSIKNIASTLGVSVGTIHRAITTFKNPSGLGLSHVDDSPAPVPAGFTLPQPEVFGTSEGML